MFTYEEKILPLPLELTQSRATSLLFLGLAVGLLGSQVGGPALGPYPSPSPSHPLTLTLTP